MSTTVLVNDNSNPVVVVAPKTVRAVAIVGQRGAAGADGSQTVLATAGEALSGHRLVVLDDSGEAVYADSSTTGHAGRILGMTIGAAAAGTTATIRTFGEVSGLSGLTPGSLLFATTTGHVSHTAPATGFVQIVGHAVTATRIIIDLQQPFIRG